MLAVQGDTPERLIPPFNLPPDGPERPKGEQLIETLLEKADAAVVISVFPTDHLRGPCEASKRLT